MVKDVDAALPYLPQCDIDLPKYVYRQQKVVAKGPAIKRASFIMLKPSIERDLKSSHFIEAMKCEYGLPACRQNCLKHEICVLR